MVAGSASTCGRSTSRSSTAGATAPCTSVRTLVTPLAWDWELIKVRLPDSLYPLYYLLRPLRLLATPGRESVPARPSARGPSVGPESRAQPKSVRTTSAHVASRSAVSSPKQRTPRTTWSAASMPSAGWARGFRACDVEASRGLGRAHGTDGGPVEVGPVPEEDDRVRGQRGRGERGWQQADRHVPAAGGAQDAVGQGIRRRGIGLEAERVREAVHPAGRKVDRRQLVAGVPEAVVQEAPGRGRLAAPRLRDQKQGTPLALEHRRVKEVEVAAPLLQLDDRSCSKRKRSIPVSSARGRSSAPRRIRNSPAGPRPTV